MIVWLLLPVLNLLVFRLHSPVLLQHRVRQDIVPFRVPYALLRRIRQREFVFLFCYVFSAFRPPGPLVQAFRKDNFPNASSWTT